MAHPNLVSELKLEATIAVKQLAAYRDVMTSGGGDERVLAARETLCRDALRDLQLASAATPTVA